MRARRVLIVLDDAGPGDALRSRFVLNAVRSAYPDALITLLVSEATAEVFEQYTPCDRLIVSRIYRAGVQGRWRNRIHKAMELGRMVRTAGKHDLVLVLNWGTLTLDLLGRLAGGRVIGYENRLGFLLSTQLGPYNVEGDPVEQNWALLAAAGIPRSATSDVANAAQPEHVGGEEMRSGPYAVLHTGSDWACQQWNSESWAVLADWLFDEYGLTIVFTGLAEEVAYITEVQSRMARPSTSLAGRTTIGYVQALVRGAAVCVTVDSAPYEVAQLTGTPVVVLAGPTSAHPQMGGHSRPIVVNRTPRDVGLQVRTCQRSHAEGHCHDYLCPLSQLPFVRVGDAMKAVNEAMSTRINPVQEVLARG
jgi:ADP-heptose:LPS heptosyltransferase